MGRKKIYIDYGFADTQKMLDTGIKHPIKKPKTMNDWIKLVVKKYPDARDNSTVLVTYYHKERYGRKLGIAYKNLLKIDSPEAIMRAYRRYKSNISDKSDRVKYPEGVKGKSR